MLSIVALAAGRGLPDRRNVMTGFPFPDHTLETAPPGSRRIMAAMAQRGNVPAAVARLASSPQLLDGFLKASALFEATSLDPVAREVVILTVAARNRCHICVAMHTAKLAALGASGDLAAALRDQRPLPGERLAAVQRFTLDVLAAAGAVSDESLAAFLGQGYTAQNALEVVLGIGAYTMSTLANRLTRAPLDEQLRAFAWDGPVAVP
jgi:AhpD family alkylhydroperoxidase